MLTLKEVNERKEMIRKMVTYHDEFLRELGARVAEEANLMSYEEYAKLYDSLSFDEKCGSQYYVLLTDEITFVCVRDLSEENISYKEYLDKYNWAWTEANKKILETLGL